MGACQGEINSQPILTGCPADTELILVMNSTAVGNNGGYGLRYIKDVRQCWLNSLKFNYTQFTVGGVGDLIGVGGTSFTINQANVIQDSVNIIIDGAVKDRNDSNVVSYSVVYSSTGFTVTFNQGASASQVFQLLYTYAT